MADGELYVTIAAGAVSSDLDFYPVHLDMSDFPDEFFDVVASDGADLRAYSVNGATRYPLAIIAIDTGAKTGHLFVRAPVFATGNSILLTFGDPSLTLPAATSDYGADRVWRGFGPVWTGYATPFFKRPWENNLIRPAVALDGNYIAISGGFLKAGREAAQDFDDYSVSFIGMRTAGTEDGAAVSITGSIVGTVDRETIYFRENGEIGVWNETDGWLSGGAWTQDALTQIGWTHQDTTDRKLFQDGALVATDTGTLIVPSTGNWKYVGAENNSMSQLLSCKVLIAYMYRGVLPARWYEFEYNNYFEAATYISYSYENKIVRPTMTIFYAGTSRADTRELSFVSTGTPGTTAANISPYVTEGIVITPAVTDLKGAEIDFAAQSDFWVSCYMRIPAVDMGVADSAMLQFFNTAVSTTQALFQVDADNGVINWEYWNGSAWVETGGDISNLTITTRVRIDIHIIMSDSAGALELYVDGALAHTATTTDTIWTAATTIDRIRFGNYEGSVNSMIWSAIFVSDEDSRALTFVHRPPIADGAQTAWTGTYDDVDETGENDANFITTTTNNAIETFTFADIGFAGSSVAAVVVSLRAQGSASSPTQIEGVARIGGVDYSQSLLEPADTAAFGPVRAIFSFNPATSNEWTVADVDAAEFGVKAIA
jgi:hypothetical protein